MSIDISKLKEDQLVSLVNNRYASSGTLWEVIKRTYERNTAVYSNESEWINKVPKKIAKIMANRIMPNTEAVINSVIANPPTMNFIAGRSDEKSADFARKMDRFYMKKYRDRNVKESMRMALRNLYFSRLFVLKPFWNAKINDFDVKPIDPRDIRCSKTARNEQESEFFIEDVKDTVSSILYRFPEKKKEILEKEGYSSDDAGETLAYLQNKEVTYQEAWIGDYVIFKHDNIILDTIRNPYWDWDGILITDDEQAEIDGSYGEARRQTFFNIKSQQKERKASQLAQQESEGEEKLPLAEGHTEAQTYKAYYFNYFDQPRKPYIIATVLNNESKPIGRTDFITLATPLQISIDKRKQDIGENCVLVNGIIKVDSSVMTKSDAQGLAYQTRGIIYGKGVANGVSRETGQGLPQMVFDDMLDSRSEIDNIMASSSAFRGEREGQETKAGRLALIQQSFLRLNELVQVVDYATGELFSWFYQLSKTRYTEYHYAKWMGKESAREAIDLIQDDFESGSEIVIVPGKTLPVDAEFRFERAQKDVAAGIISPINYMEEAGYMNPKELAKNAVMYQQNPSEAVGIEQKDLPLPHQPGNLTQGQIGESDGVQAPSLEEEQPQPEASL